MKNSSAVENQIVYESHGDLFPKSNSLINSKYKASLMEQKLFNIVLSRLQHRQFEDEGEIGGLVCTLKASELKNMLGVTGGSFYTQLKTAAASMTSTTIGYVNDEIEAFKYMSVITSAEYKKGLFTVKFNYELKKYLINEAPFTVLDLPIILSYRSVYSLRLHEILLSKCYKKKRPGVSHYTKRDSTEGKFKIDIGISELKLSLGVVNADSKAVKAILVDSAYPDYDKAVERASEKSFKDWYEFRRGVIDVAVKEINEVENGTYVTYEANKAGQGGKVYSITFFVELGNKNVDNKNVEQSEPGHSKKSNEINEEKEFEVHCNVKAMIEENLSFKDIKAICKASNYDIEKIRNAYNIAQETPNITNLVGFMIKAIQEGYTVPVKKKGRPKKNKFNNFDERQYNFDDLEKGILNAQR